MSDNGDRKSGSPPRSPRGEDSVRDRSPAPAGSPRRSASRSRSPSPKKSGSRSRSRSPRSRSPVRRSRSRSKSRSASRSPPRRRSRTPPRNRSRSPRDRAPVIDTNFTKPDLDQIEKDGVKLYIGNIDFRTAERDLEDHFAKYGKIMDIFIPRDKRTMQSKGFGFVTFYDRRDAEDAEDGTNDREFMGRRIRVNFARQRPPIDEGGRGRGRDDRGGGYGDRDRGGGRGYDDDRRGRGGGYDRGGGGGGGYDRRDDRRDYDRRDRGRY